MMANRALILGGGLVLALFATSVLAQDITAGRKRARQCTACHGPLGIAVAPNAPNLAGENSAYIATQLKAFRSGERKHQQMSIVAKKLSDQEINDLAAWFQAIEVTAKAPKLD